MQSSQTGYSWRRHFASVHLLHLCRTFLSLILRHSIQRTKAPLLFANDVPGECATISGQKHPSDTTHEIGNCWRNSHKMSQGAKTNENRWTTQPLLVTSCKTLQLLGVSSRSHAAKNMSYTTTSITPGEFYPGNRSRVKRN